MAEIVFFAKICSFKCLFGLLSHPKSFKLVEKHVLGCHWPCWCIPRLLFLVLYRKKAIWESDLRHLHRKIPLLYGFKCSKYKISSSCDLESHLRELEKSHLTLKGHPRSYNGQIYELLPNLQRKIPMLHVLSRVEECQNKILFTQGDILGCWGNDIWILRLTWPL